MLVPTWYSGKEYACQGRRHKRHRFNPWVRKIHWRRKWQLTPVFLLGKSHGQRSLEGYSTWDHKELDTTEQLNTHTKKEKASEKIFEEIIVENFPNEGKEIRHPSSGSTESHSE